MSSPRAQMRESAGFVAVVSMVMGTLFTLTNERDAHADERVECAAAYEQTQRLQQRSELMEALELADRCARPSCPAILRDECTKWVADIKPKIPSLVVRARGGDGCMLKDAKIEVAGSRRSPTEPDVLLLDPGVHEIKVTDPISKKAKTETINFAPGERRDIDIDFTAPDRVCGQPPKKPPLKLTQRTLIVGSAGGGLVLLGATLGLIGAVKRGDLNDCKPNCSSESIDAVRPFFVAGDVFAGLGILTLGAAAVLFFAIDNKPGQNQAAAVGAAATTRPQLLFGSSGLGASF